jgi:hypothetical protein
LNDPDAGKSERETAVEPFDGVFALLGRLDGDKMLHGVALRAE